jgi:hypothetical protein
MNPIRPTPSPARKPRHAPFGAATVALAAFTALVTLTGCGGGHGEEGLIADGASPAGRLATTFDAGRESDHGPRDAPGTTTGKIDQPDIIATEPQADRSATPVDRLARTQRGRYVSRTVAERIDQDSGGQVIWIDAGCCAAQDPELPERIVFGMQAVLGNDARLFVVGSDLRQAARLVDRFDRLGLGRVYLVTP